MDNIATYRSVLFFASVFKTKGNAVHGSKSTQGRVLVNEASDMNIRDIQMEMEIMMVM